MLLIIVLGIGIVSVLLIWAVKHANKETPEQIEQRMRSNLKELWENRTAPLLKFKSHEEGEQFLKLVVEGGSIRSLPPVYREQVEKYMKTMPLTIAQARTELKEERRELINQHHTHYYSPTRSVQEWECWKEQEELSVTDPVRYERLVKCGVHKRWFHMPSDEDFLCCVIDIIIQDGAPDTAKLYEYISNLTDDGIEKLINIIGNKLERLK